MNILNDKLLKVATAGNRKAKTWKNEEIKWSDFLDKLKATIRTPETMAEYKAMPKDRQSDIKDVGGFVGGYLREGRRLRVNVECRSMLTLDADTADTGLWERYKNFFGCAGAMYTTHKHTPEKPRLRLVIPLDRNVSPEEHEAIARYVAKCLVIDCFDDTTYEPHRLMFWGSCSKDGEYEFDFVDGPFLNADEILDKYVDWHDCSAWAVSSRVYSLTKDPKTTQENPLEKKGIVGAFCRAYSIEQAIEKFIPDYTPYEGGRYTYANGSTTGGVVTYDGKFSYSHHATDPASGKLCNSFDLVRLHKFGQLDVDIDPTTNANSRPSYKAMKELATKDDNVKTELLENVSSSAVDDIFKPAVEGRQTEKKIEEIEGKAGEKKDKDDRTWVKNLSFGKDGKILNTALNARIILEHDKNLKGKIQYDEFTSEIKATGALPWDKELKGIRRWKDLDDASLRLYLEKFYGVASKDKIMDAVEVTANAHSYHPVKDYLRGLKWDGTKRIDTMLIDYMGADDNAFTREATRKTLVGAVARIMNEDPNGCKFDTVLVIKGEQGIGKSSLFEMLGREWYSDSFLGVKGKESYEQLQGVWILELGELAGMSKAAVNDIKHFITKQSDKFRPAYGRRSEVFKRQNIFVGTTNETGFLRDLTGERRWWIIDTPNVSRDNHHNIRKIFTKELVDQLWAEACQLYMDGEEFWALSEPAEKIARGVQEAFTEENPKIGIIKDYLDRPLPENWKDMDTYARRKFIEDGEVGVKPRDKVSAMEIAIEAFGLSKQEASGFRCNEINRLMQAIFKDEWERKTTTTRTKYGTQKFYQRK